MNGFKCRIFTFRSIDDEELTGWSVTIFLEYLVNSNMNANPKLSMELSASINTCNAFLSCGTVHYKQN